MSQTNILLEAGTNELEIVEFYLDEAIAEMDDAAPGDSLRGAVMHPGALPAAAQVPPAQDAPAKPEQAAGTAEGQPDATPASDGGAAADSGDDAPPASDAPSEGGHTTVYRGYYGVNVAKVTEIIRMPKVTELPEVQHPCIQGAFNLRERIVPLVDLGMWLGKVPANKEQDTKAIVTEFNNVNTAFMVTGVNRIHRISWEEVEPPNAYVAAVSSDTIVGVIKLEDRIVFLLDLEKVVSNLNPSLGLHLDGLGANWDSSLGYRALIADDSALVRGMQRDLLEKAGYHVKVTTNGREAWEYLMDCKRRVEEEGRPLKDFVQVVVTDIEMPIMDGLNLCSRIKEDPILKRLPVLIFSSLVTEKLKHRGVSVGADGQISKPEVGQLARRAADLIMQRESEDAAQQS